MNLENVEIELKKRLAQPYIWGRKQNDYWDKLSAFIYSSASYEQVIKEINERYDSIQNKSEISRNDFFNYSINRWYNFWSAAAVEKIFCGLPGVEAALNEYDRLVDFTIRGIRFDHKTSVFPGKYNGTIEEARKNPKELIQWLYDNQSQQQRKHMKNRLFIVLYDPNGQHWKLKSEICWLKGLIVDYIKKLDISNLYKFYFEGDNETLSDIVWGIK